MKPPKQEVRSYLRKYLLNWHQTWYRCSGPCSKEDHKRLCHLTARGRSLVWHVNLWYQMNWCGRHYTFYKKCFPYSSNKMFQYSPNLAQIIFRPQSHWHVKIGLNYSCLNLGQIWQPLASCHGAHGDGAPVCVTGILIRTCFVLGLIRTAI